MAQIIEWLKIPLSEWDNFEADMWDNGNLALEINDNNIVALCFLPKSEAIRLYEFLKKYYDA